MAKPGRRTAAEASMGAGSEPLDGGAPHKMKLRRRPALGDISSVVSNNAGARAQDKGAVAGGARQTVSSYIRQRD